MLVVMSIVGTIYISLLLQRSLQTRRREHAIYRALGFDRQRIGGLLLGEYIVHIFIATGLSLALAWIGPWLIRPSSESALSLFLILPLLALINVVILLLAYVQISSA
jgi:predicted lysophospholipase L1 biosynthesis ABC-type transport system permease subunit